MIKLFKDNLPLLFLIIFSGILALGTWNPFVAISSSDNTESGVGLAQIVSVIFIAYLFLRKSDLIISMERWSKTLYVFFFLFIFSSIIDLNNISVSVIVLLLKLLLDIILCILLPKIFLENKNYIYISIYTFAIVTSIIAVLYWCGLLEPFVEFSQGRLFLFGENPNSTSARFSLAIIFLLNILLRNPFGWSKIRYLQLIFLFPLVNLVLASGSRGSFIILILCFFLYLLLYPQNNLINKIFIVIIFSIIFIAGGIYILNNNADYSMIERLLDAYNSGNDAGRDLLNSYAISIWCDAPIIGEGIKGGAEMMRIQFNETRTVHNLYFYLLSTSGLVGFLSFIYFIYKLFRDAVDVKNDEPISLIILLFMLLIAYKTGGVLTYILMWYVFSIVITFKVMKLYEE